jgi:hypothetical protein
MSASHDTRLAEHDAAIESLRQSADETRRELKAVAGDMRTGFERLTTAVHEIRGAAGPSLKDMLDIGTRVGLLVSLIVGGIVYVSRGGNSAELHQLELRVQRIETLLGMAMAPKLRPTPGAWAGH